jgi:hypothetical protein
MEKSKLILTAAALPAFSENAINEYISKSALMVGKVNNIMTNRADIASLAGSENISMMTDNHANHARFIASILKKFDAEVLTDTILWVFRAYRSHGFTTNYWAAQLNTWIIVLNETLSEKSFAELYPLYEWMQVNIPQFVALSDIQLTNAVTTH